MQLITITVDGITPVLLHNPAGMSTGGETSVSAKGKSIPTPEVEAEHGTYRLPDGSLCIPSFAFRGALLSAAKGRKVGKSFATTLVKGSVFVTSEMTQLLDPDGNPIKDYEIDMRRAMVGNAGITRCRPKIDPWSADVTFEYDDDFIHEDHIYELMDIAGRTVGVGDFRPEKSGPFGRFVVRDEPEGDEG